MSFGFDKSDHNFILIFFVIMGKNEDAEFWGRFLIIIVSCYYAMVLILFLDECFGTGTVELFLRQRYALIFTSWIPLLLPVYFFFNWSFILESVDPKEITNFRKKMEQKKQKEENQKNQEKKEKHLAEQKRIQDQLDEEAKSRQEEYKKRIEPYTYRVHNGLLYLSGPDLEFCEPVNNIRGCVRRRNANTFHQYVTCLEMKTTSGVFCTPTIYDNMDQALKECFAFLQMIVQSNVPTCSFQRE